MERGAITKMPGRVKQTGNVLIPQAINVMQVSAFRLMVHRGEEYRHASNQLLLGGGHNFRVKYTQV